MQPCILIKTTSLTSSHMNPSINTFYAFLPSKTQQGFHLGNCCIQKPHAAAAAGGGLDNPPPSASGPLAAPQTSAQGIGGLGSWRARTRAGYCAKPSPACARLLLFSLITWEIHFTWLVRFVFSRTSVARAIRVVVVEPASC
jgi:hypothetical protein